MRIPVQDKRASLRRIAATRENSNRSLLAAKISLRGLDAPSNHEKARRRFSIDTGSNHDEEEITRPLARKSSWIKPVPTWEQRQQQQQQSRSRTVGEPNQKWKKPTPMQVGATNANAPLPLENGFNNTKDKKETYVSNNIWKQKDRLIAESNDMSNSNDSEKDKSETIVSNNIWKQKDRLIAESNEISKSNDSEKDKSETIVSSNIWKQKDKLMAESNSRSKAVGASPRKWKNPTPQGEPKSTPSPSAATVSSVPKWKKPESPSSPTFPTKDSSTTVAPVKKWKKPNKSVSLPPAATAANNMMVTPTKWKRPAVSATTNDTRELSPSLPSTTKSPIRVWKNHTAALKEPSTVKDSNVDTAVVKKWKKPTTVAATGNESDTNGSKTPAVVKKWKRPEVEAVTEPSVTEPSSHFQNSVARFNKVGATDPKPERRQRPRRRNSIDNSTHDDVSSHKPERFQRPRRRSSMNNAVSSTFAEKDNYSNTFQAPAVVKKWKRPEAVAKPLTENDKNTNASKTPTVVKKWKRPEAAKEAVEPSTEKASKPAAFEKWKKLTEAAPRVGSSPETIKKTGNASPPAAVKKWKQPPVAESWIRNNGSNAASSGPSPETIKKTSNATSPVAVKKWKKPSVAESGTQNDGSPATVKKWSKPTVAPVAAKKISNATSPVTVKKWKKPPVAESWIRNNGSNAATAATVKKWSKPTVAPMDAKVIATPNAKKAILSKSEYSTPAWKCKTPVQTPNNLQSSPTSVIRPEISQSATTKQWEKHCIASPKPDEKISKLESTTNASKWKKSELPQSSQTQTTPKLQGKLAVATENICVVPTEAKKATTTESTTENTCGAPLKVEKEITTPIEEASSVTLIESEETKTTATESIGEDGSVTSLESVEAKMTTTESIAETGSVTSFESEEERTTPTESKAETGSVTSFESEEEMAAPTESKEETNSVASFEASFEFEEEMTATIESKTETSSVVSFESEKGDVNVGPLKITPESMPSKTRTNEEDISVTLPTPEGGTATLEPSPLKKEPAKPFDVVIDIDTLKSPKKFILPRRSNSFSSPSSSAKPKLSLSNQTKNILKLIEPSDLNSDVQTPKQPKERTVPRPSNSFSSPLSSTEPKLSVSSEVKAILQNVPSLPSLPPELRVDGNPMDHWDKANFDKKRDNVSRIVLEPKDGEEFYKQIFDDHAYEIMRKTSIEQPYFSKYNRFFPMQGHFCCKACGNALYDWKAKFDAENGWPAFGTCVRGSLEVSTEATALGDDVDEIHCLKCRSHIGNVVLEENWGKRGVRFKERHRVNGRSLKYIATNLGKRTTTNYTLLYKEGIKEPVRSFF